LHPAQQQLHVAITPPTVDIPDTTNTRTRQQAWPHRYDLGRGR
jgi:hypothetical protein